ncbi:MAG TPA: Na+/H+ antiporter NhaC family protein, partial [Treponemataceae bacterium]|nr:Na+/H+ antiporter NhaC family protein [Treponemataceae bacterium]
AAPGDVEHIENPRARSIDMLFPIITLIVCAVVFFPLTTWLAAVDGQKYLTLGAAVSAIPIGVAFNDTDASVALFYAAVFTLVITYVYYLARRLLTIKSASESLRDGIASMVPALIVLTMAWTIGGVIKSSPADGGLGLAKYLSEVVVGGGFPVWLLPAVVFILSAVISFSTGTSWGTFTIMIPIVMPIIVALAETKGLAGGALINACMISVSAVLSGAIFGDHSSPISDTTILSSTGAGCPHLEHVSTQLPYALFVAGASLVGFAVGGVLLSDIAGIISALCVFTLGLVFLPRLYKG